MIKLANKSVYGWDNALRGAKIRNLQNANTDLLDKNRELEEKTTKLKYIIDQQYKTIKGLM